jgi:hypothetical protein
MDLEAGALPLCHPGITGQMNEVAKSVFPSYADATIQSVIWNWRLCA